MTGHERRKGKWTWLKPPGAPKRPLSAYNYFFSEMRKKIKTETNDGKTGGFSTLAKQISCWWKDISDLEKQKYINMANESKEKYLLLKKDWSQTEGYKVVLNEKHAKKRVSRASYRARVKSKQICEKSDYKLGYPVSSLVDFMDGINYNLLSQAGYHVMHQHDIAKEGEQIGKKVVTIEGDDASQFTTSCHGTVSHHDIYNINDIHVPSDSNQDEISVSDLSGNGSVQAIDEQLECSSTCLHTSHDAVATTDHDGNPFAQRFDQGSNCISSYLSSQENDIPNYDQSSYLSTMQPGISEIQRLYSSRQGTCSWTFPAVHQKPLDIDRITANSLGLDSINQYHRVLNTANSLFCHSTGPSINDTSMLMDGYNSAAISSYNDSSDLLLRFYNDRLDTMSSNVQLCHKPICRIFTKDCLPATNAHTSTCVQDP